MMKRHALALLCLALLAPATPAVGQARQTSVKYHMVLAVASTPPAAPTIGDQYLIGPAPALVWAGHSGEIASWNGKGWVAKAVNSPDQVYDATTGSIYAKVDTASAANLWVGSKFVRLSEGFAKYRPRGPELGSLYIDAAYRDASITSSPNLPSTFTLRNPGINGDTFGMSVRIEKFPGTQDSLTIDVDNGGILCDQNLAIISPLTIPNLDGKVLELRAGDPSSHCSWYAQSYVP